MPGFYFAAQRGRRRGELIHGRRSDKFWLGWANENSTDFPSAQIPFAVISILSPTLSRNTP
jgi:hypothetical protein